MELRAHRAHITRYEKAAHNTWQRQYETYSSLLELAERRQATISAIARRTNQYVERLKATMSWSMLWLEATCLRVANKFTWGSMNHIHSTCSKQWHSVIPSITDNQGNPKDHPEEIVQKEHPPVAKIEWKFFHSIGKSILTTWSGTRPHPTSSGMAKETMGGPIV